jgi:hypothetical protein
MLLAGDYVWRRIRQTIRSRRDQAAFTQAHTELLGLHRKENTGKLALYYLDETGFSLQPVVPYGWQKRDSRVGSLSGSHHKRVNVLGMLQCNGDFDSYMFEGTITSDVVAGCIDAFIARLRRDVTQLPVVLVLDNASIHDSEDFKDHEKRWRKLRVRLKRLPRYSPELNMIEVLWRRIKYNWMPFDATESWETLVESVEDVLKGIGTKHQITFA